MHLMTRLPESARIRAPFDGATFHFKDDTARLSQKDGARFVRLSSPRARRSSLPGHARHRRPRTARTSRASRSPASRPTRPRSSPPGRGADAELLLPISYVFETASFRLKGYSVLVGERPGMRAGGVWNETCIFCHNTTPYFDSIWGELYGPRRAVLPGGGGRSAAPARPALAVRPARQRTRGPASRRCWTRSRPRSPPSAARRETAGSGDRRTALAHGIGELRAAFRAAPLRRGRHRLRGLPRRQPRARRRPAGPPRLRAAQRVPGGAARGGPREVTRAEQVNRVCARCHQVLFSRYPFTWEGGERRHNPGGSSITSGEARDFLLGRLRAPDVVRRPATIRTPPIARRARAAGDGRRATRSASRCHAPVRGARGARRARPPRSGRGGGELHRLPHAAQEHGARLRAHPLPPHRPARRSGAGRARSADRVRALPRRQDGGRPGRHDGELVGTKVRSRRARRALRQPRRASARGDADARQGARAGGRARDARRRAASRRAIPGVARQLVNPFPLVRYYARRALESLRGPCAVDLDRPTAEIAAAVRACVPKAFPEAGAAPSVGPAPGADAPDED